MKDEFSDPWLAPYGRKTSVCQIETRDRNDSVLPVTYCSMTDPSVSVLGMQVLAVEFSLEVPVVPIVFLEEMTISEGGKAVRRKSQTL